MYGKKSLGHSPINSRFEDAGSCDFIPDLISKKKKPDTPGKASSDRQTASNKKVVSYYIEEHIVGAIRKQAVKTDQSYSSVAARAFSFYLNNKCSPE
ncbi:MAG: hypothetical protein WEC12_07705 [Balneolaceae bacterium]